MPKYLELSAHVLLDSESLCMEQNGARDEKKQADAKDNEKKTETKNKK